ncbi:MAG: MoxR family ATPase [Acidobacteriota bacterium]|nr:MAG: MoxR family ATPase [Acidobacteriota bacterium]
MDVAAIQAQIERDGASLRALTSEIRKVIVGQNDLVERILIGLLAPGHILLEGVPGLAKTLAVSTTAAAIDASFSRIQFTPDLLPADLVGTLIYSQKDGSFVPRKGPLFAHLILADEINRAPAKVQSALLEAMQERQITIGDKTYPLEEPFLVLATQNPIEQEGTYPLPEAQVDRFMMKVKVGYPSKEEEKTIMERMGLRAVPEASAVVAREDILRTRDTVESVYVDDKVKDYIVNLVYATREPKEFGLDLAGLIEYGASPRASLYLLKAARAHAFLRGRGYVTPEDVKTIGYDVLRHRIILTYEALAENTTTDGVIRKIFDGVEVP